MHLNQPKRGPARAVQIEVAFEKDLHGQAGGPALVAKAHTTWDRQCFDGCLSHGEDLYMEVPTGDEVAFKLLQGHCDRHGS